MKTERTGLKRLNESTYSLFTDKYEHSMMYGYFKNKEKDGKVVFDMFYRSVPDGGGYALSAGLDLVIEMIQNLKFTKEDIEYLRATGPYDEEYLKFLENDYKFTGSIEAMPEGTIIFPGEVILKVTATPIEAQHVEDIVLNCINSQSLIATKASRICYAAQGEGVMDFGLRRGAAYHGATLASRAAYIGGCIATSNDTTSKVYGVPSTGTMAHSWILMFDSEEEAFMAYADTYKENIILLVDTYNTLKSGVPKAIKVFKKLRDEGRLPKKYGVRLDSGDLTYLSIETRKMLDAEGFTDAVICASNDLDERLIQDLKRQGAKINLWATGTKLITSYTCPAFNGVYKLAAKEENGVMVPVIKLSETKVKVTNPGDKTVYRIADKETGYFIADLICLADETFDITQDLLIFDPEFTAKKKRLKGGTYTMEKLLVPIFKDGVCVYENKQVKDIRDYALNQLSHLWPEVRRFDNPHKYYVDLSEKLYNLKEKMIAQNSFEN